ncbi:MAG: signal peptidase I [Phycisphaeraceae bacterium]|nr:signal peptidase I [Phycisphaeraceae bacterium]
MARLSFGRRLWIEWIRPVGTVILTLSILRSAVADWNDVPTGSMKPTIMEGDRIYVNKAAYGLRLPFTLHWLARWDTPERSEIVVCFSPKDGTRLVKRVVGVPGDTVELRKGLVYINGQPCDYEPIDSLTEQAFLEGIDHADIREVQEESIAGAEPHAVMHFTRDGQFAARDFGPVEIPPHAYFLMGDNRDESGDSRIFGYVPEDRIVGSSGAVAISVDPDNYYLPRFSRFFKSLP